MKKIPFTDMLPKLNFTKTEILPKLKYHKKKLNKIKIKSESKSKSRRWALIPWSCFIE